MIDDNFTINIEPYLEKIKEIPQIINDKEYNIPVFLVKENELVEAIIKKVAQGTYLAQKYNIEPTVITYFIKVFNKYNTFPVDRLNTLVQLILKYKDLGIPLLLHPTLVSSTKERILRIYIDEIITNYNIVLAILRNLFKSDISHYWVLYDKENFYVREFTLEGYLTVNNEEFVYEALYPIEMNFIDYLIKQNMREPRNIIINKDNKQDKYLISWEY
jgi:hypothetical protein